MPPPPQLPTAHCTSSSPLLLSPPEMNSFSAIRIQLRSALLWESLPSLSWAICVTFFGTPKMKVAQSCLILCNPMDYPWNSPGHSTGVGGLSLLQGTFPTPGLNPGLPHRRQILYQLSHKRGPCGDPVGIPGETLFFSGYLRRLSCSDWCQEF